MYTARRPPPLKKRYYYVEKRSNNISRWTHDSLESLFYLGTLFRQVVSSSTSALQIFVCRRFRFGLHFFRKSALRFKNHASLPLGDAHYRSLVGGHAFGGQIYWLITTGLEDRHAGVRRKICTRHGVRHR